MQRRFRNDVTGQKTTLRVKNGVMEVTNHDTHPKRMRALMAANAARSDVKQRSKNIRHVANIDMNKWQELRWEWEGKLPSQRRNKIRPRDSFTFEEFLNMKVLNERNYNRFRTWQGKL